MEEEILQRLNTIERWAVLAAKNVLNIEDVSVLTGLSKSTVYKMTSNHEIPYYKPNGKQVFFDRAEVEAWMKQNRVGSVCDAESSAAAFCVGQGLKGGAL